MIESISAQGEFGLASRRTVRLLDIRLPLGEDEFARSLAWLHSLSGRRVTVAVIAGEDRWRRNVADVALLDEPAPIDLAELLVAEGLAMVDADDRNDLCRPGLLAEEDRARRRRVGVWRNGGHAPVDANDSLRLEALIGSFALVEGIVRSVGERRERTYLNFGQDWKQDLTITIPKRTWAMILRQRGPSAAAALKGQRVRARGVLERWQGVAMEITAPDMLELIGQDTTRP